MVRVCRWLSTLAQASSQRFLIHTHLSLSYVNILQIKCNLTWHIPLAVSSSYFLAYIVEFNILYFIIIFIIFDCLIYGFIAFHSLFKVLRIDLD